MEFAEKRRGFLEENGYTVTRCGAADWHVYCDKTDLKKDEELQKRLFHPHIQEGLISAIRTVFLRVFGLVLIVLGTSDQRTK